jgi:ABC-type antimicrobial peptide transport system permease subunit
MGMCLGFAALALLLAGVGVYGVLAYSVSQRTREFGIRAALGADPRSLVGMVVGQGFRLAGLGLAIGAGGALLLTRLAASLLFDVKPADPIVYVSVAMALAVVAGVASLIPSARVVRIAPSSALRYE